MGTNIDSHIVTLKKLPFYDDNTKKTKELIDKTANLSDDDIVQISKSAAYKSANNSKAAKAQKALYPAIIGTFIASNVIANKGPASSKIATAAIGVLSYAALNASINGAVKIAEKTAEKTGKDKDTARDVAYLGSIAGFALLYKSAINGISRVGKSLIKKLPEGLKQSAKTNRGKFDTALKNSAITKAFSKHIAQPAKKLVTKFPRASKFLSQHLGIIGIVTYITGSALLANKIAKDTQDTYSNTKSALFLKREECKSASELLNTAENKYNSEYDKGEFNVDISPLMDAVNKE